MAVFQYKGRTNRGDAVEGKIEAASPDAVATQLFNSGITPIDINEALERKDPFEGLRRKFAGGARIEDLILFSRQMHTLMRSGVPIIRSINSLADSTRHVFFAEALHDVVESLEAGRDLSTSLGQHPKIFSSLFVSIINVGENTGRLDEAFLQIAEYLELEKDTRDRIKQAMRYPTIVIVAIAVAIVVINLVVIPQFSRVYAGFNAELPLATRFLIGVSEFTLAYWHWLLGAVVLSAIAIISYVRTDNGRYRWHKAKLRIPVVGGIILRSLLARFARSFAMATRSGVPLIQTMTVVSRAVDNDFVAERILNMRNGVERGDTLTRTAAATNLFTPLVLQMMSVGEETGQVDELLEQVGQYYEREVDYDLKNLSSLIEPVLLVAIGIMVLILALGVFLPMWDLATAASGK
ncbi:MAG: type II secretion system F family protein [Granulosicoccaceae bacterium]|jgi:MSHA biogenesis protein MshG